MSFQKIPGLAELTVSQMDVKILTAELQYITEAINSLTGALTDAELGERDQIVAASESLIERGQVVRERLITAADAHMAQINAYRAANIQQSAN